MMHVLVKYLRYTDNHMQHDSDSFQNIKNEPNEPQQGSVKKTVDESSTHYIRNTLLVIVIFSLGYLLGTGKLHLFSDNGYNSTSKTSTKLDFSSVNELYGTLQRYYDGTFTSQQALEGLKHGLARSTKDPYTEFFTKDESTKFNDDLQGTIIGIGAKLELDKEGNIVIVAPIAGSPAEAAGLRAKDVIVSVDGKSTAGMTATEAVLQIRGKKNTTVELGVIRDRQTPLEFKIVRDTIKVPSVVAEVLDGGIGHLQVSQFSSDTDELVADAVDQFKAKGVQKVILDLRDNPGGEIDSAVGLTSFWLQQGETVVEQRRGKTVIDVSRSNGDNPLRGIPTVVLVNGGSASASEITALALRDYRAARVIGETTYGKGVVQQLIPFDDGSALKVTIAKWYSPKGTNIDQKGLKPDQEIIPTEEDYTNNRDVQLNAAVEWLASQP